MSTRTFTFNVVDLSAMPAWVPSVPVSVPTLYTISSVSGGASTMYETIPAEWKPPAANLSWSSNVFTAWCGGRGDAASRRLFIHGGGHGDSANNGLYTYDFNGNTPFGWRLEASSLSARADVVADANLYADNRPTSIHSYDQQWFCPSTNRFFRFGGSRYGGSGGTSGQAHYYDFNARSWSSYPSGSVWFTFPAAPSLASSVLGAPDDSWFFFNSGTGGFRFIRSDGLASVGGASPVLWGTADANPTAVRNTTLSAADLTSDKWLMMGYGSSLRVWLVTINWTTQTVSATQIADPDGSHATHLGSNSEGASLVFDAQRNSYWIFGTRAQTSSGSISYLLEMNATTYAVTRWNLAGGSITASGTGSFNKHVWFPDWRLIATCQAYNQPMSLIKLPN